MSIVPSNRPGLSRSFARELLAAARIDAKVALVARRGYYRDTMGDPGENDINIYDDAIALVSPTAYATFNANCDPSRRAPGMANLKAGVWLYKIGIHGLSRPKEFRYKALVQAKPVTVVRDDRGDDTGMFGVNIHRGGHATTSSLGCLTIHPSQWPGFIALVEEEMQRHGQMTIPLLLSDRPNAA